MIAKVEEAHVCSTETENDAEFCSVVVDIVFPAVEENQRFNRPEAATSRSSNCPALPIHAALHAIITSDAITVTRLSHHVAAGRRKTSDLAGSDSLRKPVQTSSHAIANHLPLSASYSKVGRLLQQTPAVSAGVTPATSTCEPPGPMAHPCPTRRDHCCCILTALRVDDSGRELKALHRRTKAQSDGPCSTRYFCRRRRASSTPNAMRVRFVSRRQAPC